MPRPPSLRWDARSRRWIAQVGEVSATTGRRARVILRDERGEPVGEKDRAGAHAALARRLAEVAADRQASLGPTAYEVVKAYLLWHQANGSMPDTIATHKWHLFRFLDHECAGVRYSDRPAAEMEVADWTRYRKAMEHGGAQTGYVLLAYSSVHACWRWAARPEPDRVPLRLIPTNPFEGLKRPKKGRGRRLVLPWSTIRAIGSFVTAWVERPAPEGAPRNRKVAINRERPANRLKALACRLIIESGCRPKEAAMCRWDWVHESERVIEIPEEVIKTHEDRFVPLQPEMAARLAELRTAGYCHPTWVFLLADDPRTEPLDAHRLAEWFGKARTAARAEGIELPPGTSLYTFRHSLVTLAHGAGMDLRQIAPAFGHSAETAERTYAHLQRGHVVRVMDEAWSRIRAGEPEKSD